VTAASAGDASAMLDAIIATFGTPEPTFSGGGIGEREADGVRIGS
jgi:hypothetical protein